MSEKVTIRCKVLDKKPIYYNPTNYYTVERYQNTDTLEFFTASGKGIPKIENMSCILVGDWTNSTKYGLQFVVNEFQEDDTATAENCFSFLSSGLIKGVGIKTAEKIVDKFGDKSLEILETNPQEYLTIPGITKNKLNTILESYQENRSMKVVTSLMTKYNLTLNKCIKIYEKFHTKADCIIKNDTYQLCEIDGFGFITVDEIARDQNPEVLTSDKRFEAIVRHVLKENEQTGSLYMNKQKFQTDVVNLFNHNLTQTYSMEYILDNINRVCKNIIQESDGGKVIGLIRNFNMEKETAQALINLIQSPSNSYIEMNSLKMDNLISKISLNLSEEQLKAVKMVMSNNVSIITGGAGTGKTTVLKAILEIYSNKEVLLMAPTGRAAKRMSEATNFPASTIHSALKILTSDAVSKYTEDYVEQLVADIIIVDETSMLDAYIASLLFTHIEYGSKVVLIGDVNQLPSVGAGNVLNELIDSTKIPTFRLTYNFRQNAGSLIAINANKILEQDTDLTYTREEFFLSDIMNDELAANTLAGLYERAVAKFGYTDVALITPFRKNFSCGANSLNKNIQEYLNPKKPDELEYYNNGETFRVSDRVMQIKNRPYAMNGDIGTIQSIENVNLNGYNTIRIGVLFDGTQTIVFYDTKALDELCLAYAMTVHKSQGSEYDIVILAYENNSNLMLTKNLIYTAITRAKKRVVIVGQKELINISIYRDYINNRISYLSDFINSKII